MKPKSNCFTCLTVVFLTMLYCNVIKAQDTTIIFDNAAGVITQRPEWCKEGTSVSLNIIHANPYALDSKMSIEITNADYNDGKDVFSDAMNLSSENATSSATEDVNTETVNETREKISEEVNKMYNLQVFSLMEEPDIEALLAKKNEILKLIQFEFNKADKARADINSILALDTVVVSLMNNPNIYSRDMFHSYILNFYGSDIEAAYQIGQIFGEQVEILRHALQNIRFDIETLRRLNEILKQSGHDDKSDAYLDSLLTLVQKIEDVYAGDNFNNMEQKLYSLKTNFMHMSESDFIIQGDKVPNLSGDFLMIGDTLTLKNGTIYKAIQPIKIRSYCGTRIDFSAGFATTFGAINGTDYFLLRDTSSNVIGLDSSTANRKFDFNPVAFTHLTFKIPSVLTPGISFGVNPDFSDLEESRLMLGATLGISATNNIARRILLSGGATIGFTDQLKSKYSNVSDWGSLDDLSDEDLSVKALNWGWFFAVSFNLGN